MIDTNKLETRHRPIDGHRRHNVHGLRIGEVYTQDHNIYITEVRTFGAPERDVTFQSVPGRSGDLTLDNGRWKNVEIVYGCAIPTDFTTFFSGFKAALAGLVGYLRIEDTIEPDVFRMGLLSGSVDAGVVRRGLAGTFDIHINCKPQKYLKSGEESQTLVKAGIINNAWGGTAKPLITVYGTGPGNLYVGNCTVAIKALSDRITLDCDQMNAYLQTENGLENKNRDIYAPVFPELAPGETALYWDGGITHIDCIPRWWRL